MSTLRRDAAKALVFAVCAFALSQTAHASCTSRECGDDAAVEAVRSLVSAACDCTGSKRHKQYVKCARDIVKSAVRDRTLPRECRKTVARCEAQTTCGLVNTTICCAQKRGRVKARMIKAGGKCPGTVCQGAVSMAEACTPEGTCAPRRQTSRFRAMQKIFQTSCALPSCHSTFARQGSLVLEREDVSYSSLVNRPAALPAAKALNLMRVVPGDPAASFLVQKLRGTGPGDAMPQASERLSEPILKLVEDWISHGALSAEEECKTASVCDEQPVPTGTYVWQPEPGLDVPAPGAGIQLYMPPRDVPSGTEWESCYVYRPNWLEIANLIGGTPVVKQQVFRMHKATHHLLLYMYLGQHPEEWPDGSFPCRGLHGLKAAVGPADAGQSTILVGGTSFTHYTVSYPNGVGLPMLPGAVLLADLHMTNPFQPPQPMYGEAWINLDFYKNGEWSVLIDGVLNALENDLLIQPYETRTISSIWTPRTLLGWPVSFGAPQDAAVFQLYGHYHKRGELFQIDYLRGGQCSLSGALCGRDDDCACRAWQRGCQPGQTCVRAPDAEDATIYYSTNSWDDLPVVDYPKPFLLVDRNEGLRTTCRFTNGVLGDPTRPPKRCDQDCEACGWDAATRTCLFERGFELGVDPAPRRYTEGEPMPLVFGELTDDEMCTMAGYYIHQEDLAKLPQ